MSKAILSLHKAVESADKPEAMGTMHGTTVVALLDMILEHT
jgi:hypothetical protein